MPKKLGAASAHARASRAATSRPKQEPTSISSLAKPCESGDKSEANTASAAPPPIVAQSNIRYEAKSAS